MHSYNLVSYKPGPFCVIIYDNGEQEKKREAEPSLRKANFSSPPMTAQMIKEQLDNVTAELQAFEAKRTSMAQLTQGSKLIFEEAVPLAKDIQALQNLLVQKQQHLDTLDSKYTIMRQDFEALKTSYDESKYQSLLRLKSSLNENMLSQQKKDDCHRLANRLGVSFQHIEVMLTYMTESEVLKHFKVENGSTGSTLISEPEAKMPNDDDLCTICLSSKRTYMLFIAGTLHTVKRVMDLNECSICREPVTGRQRVFV